MNRTTVPGPNYLLAIHREHLVQRLPDAPEHLSLANNAFAARAPDSGFDSTLSGRSSRIMRCKRVGKNWETEGG